MEFVTRADFIDRLERNLISYGIRQDVILFYPVARLTDALPLPPDTTGTPIAYPHPNLNWYCVCDHQGFVLTVSSGMQDTDLVYIETNFTEPESNSADWKVISAIAPLVRFLDARFGLIESRCAYRKTGQYYAMTTDSQHETYYVYEAETEAEAHQACETLRQSQPNAEYFVLSKDEFHKSCE
ncbi:hypothetical protein V6x_43690 [Gimesia chilikensis]|uniref:Uncharacterized protein n=1 Tax=Gimesia chilikensis TaxID=2605989 RepID=A0A517WHB8_9PLAN|nr:hypothetical protein [Gimesia chilikensis]QDU04640.1 hypothetical protein V6x_43690 [Gimesia chilikensis]